MGFQELEELKPIGSTETGELFEQKVEINYEGESLVLRRIVLKLFVPTRDKEWEIAIFSNLPEVVTAAKIAEIYRNRWTIENLFQTVTQNFNGEIQNDRLSKSCFLLQTWAGRKPTPPSLRYFHFQWH